MPVDIIERASSTYSQHVYYIASTSTAGILVTKLDSIGQKFVPIPANPIDDANEFIFENGGTPARPVALSYNNQPAAFDHGLQVLGDHSSVGGQQCFVNTSFNGVISSFGQCANSGTFQMSSIPFKNGPGETTTVGLNPGTALNYCANISFTVSAAASTTNVICWTGTTSANSFNRPVTSLEDINGNPLLKIYPNPTTRSIVLAPEDGVILGDLNLILYNQVGQMIQVIENRSFDNKNGTELDLHEIGLSPGFYFIEVNYQNTKTIEKIIYSSR